MAKFSGDVFNKLVRSQAANEVAEARGQVDTFIESFSTFVADNPNASPDELQQKWNKISSQIKAIPGTLKTGLGKTEFGNHLALNWGRINQIAQTRMEAIKSKQELGRYQVLRENYINNFDKKSLAKLNAEQVKEGLLDPEITKFQQEQDFKVIDIAQKKTQLEQLQNNVLNIAQSFRDAKTGEIDLKAGQDFIKKSDLPTDVKLNALRDLNLWHAREQQALDQKREVDRGVINDLIYKDLEFDKAIDAINDSSLDEKEQGSKMKLARDLQLAMAKGGKDAKQEKAKADLFIKISQNPRKYNEDFFADEALKGNIHPSYLPALKLWRDKVIKGLTGTISAKQGFKLLEIYNKKGVFGKGTDGANLYIEVVDNFKEFLDGFNRSEERRVGKECRSRWSPYH